MQQVPDAGLDLRLRRKVVWTFGAVVPVVLAVGAAWMLWVP